MKRREFIGLLGAVLTVRPQDGAAQSATIRRDVAMTESSTVKDLGAVFDGTRPNCRHLVKADSEAGVGNPMSAIGT